MAARPVGPTQAYSTCVAQVHAAASQEQARELYCWGFERERAKARMPAPQAELDVKTAHGFVIRRSVVSARRILGERTGREQNLFDGLAHGFDPGPERPSHTHGTFAPEALNLRNAEPDWFVHRRHSSRSDVEYQVA